MLTVTGIRAHTLTMQSVAVTEVGVAGSELENEQVDCCRTVEVPFCSLTQTWLVFGHAAGRQAEGLGLHGGAPAAVAGGGGRRRGGRAVPGALADRVGGPEGVVEAHPGSRHAEQQHHQERHDQGELDRGRTLFRAPSAREAVHGAPFRWIERLIDRKRWSRRPDSIVRTIQPRFRHQSRMAPERRQRASEHLVARLGRRSRLVVRCSHRVRSGMRCASRRAAI